MQAAARVWRMGQRQEVFVHRLVYSGTMGGVTYKRAVDKESLFKRAIDSKTVKGELEVGSALRYLIAASAPADGPACACLLSMLSVLDARATMSWDGWRSLRLALLLDIMRSMVCCIAAAGMHSVEDLEWYSFEHHEPADPATVRAAAQQHAGDAALQVFEHAEQMLSCAHVHCPI